MPATKSMIISNYQLNMPIKRAIYLLSHYNAADLSLLSD
jgi:hypothetical protein